ncbi:MAG: hypothetical protein MJ232_04920 [archaeon]|nr:hypothetical protein [archaeon]
MRDVNYIKRFGKITVDKACKKAGVARNNLYIGKVKPEKVNEVIENIESEIAKLYIKEGTKDNEETIEIKD